MKIRLFHDRQPKKMWYYKSVVFPWTGSRSSRHWEDSTYVGLSFAQELIEMYYRVFCFALHHSSFHILDTFMQQEPCGYGVLISDMICHLELTIGFKDCIGWDENRDYKVRFDETKEQTALQKSDLEEQLQALVLIKKRCRIDIIFWIWHGAGKAGILQFGEMIDVLLPIISILKTRGSTINLSINSSTLETYGSKKAFGKWLILDKAAEPVGCIADTGTYRLKCEMTREIVPQRARALIPVGRLASHRLENDRIEIAAQRPGRHRGRS